MSIIDLLIVLACLATGYWIVNSIISSGGWNGPDGNVNSAGTNPSREPVTRDWHIVLDIPSDSSRRDIQAAMKRRLAQAEANCDAAEAERIRKAAESGFKVAR